MLFLFFISQMIYRRFFSGRSDGDQCTLYSDRTLINRRNVKGDPSSAYRADRDFFMLVVKSRVIAAARAVLGFNDRASQPMNFALPDLENTTKLQKLEYLHEAAALIVDSCVFDYDALNKAVDDVITTQGRQDVLDQQQLTADGRFPCRFPGCKRSFKYDGKSRRSHELSHDPPPEIPVDPIVESAEPTSIKPSPKSSKQDDVYSYNCALLEDGLFFMNFLDAVSEGDGKRIMRQYKYFMVMCKADGSHSTKYALECLYQLFLVKSLLSPRDSERFTWNRSVNTMGGKGKNVALDLDMEHSNRFLKQAIKNLGPNVTERAVARICHAQREIQILTDTIDQDILRVAGSGRHTRSSTERDLQELVDRAISTDVYNEQEGRHYNHFLNFERSKLSNLDMSSVFKWINDHKKNIDNGIRAR